MLENQATQFLPFSKILVAWGMMIQGVEGPIVSTNKRTLVEVHTMLSREISASSITFKAC